MSVFVSAAQLATLTGYERELLDGFSVQQATRQGRGDIQAEGVGCTNMFMVVDEKTSFWKF